MLTSIPNVEEVTYLSGHPRPLEEKKKVEQHLLGTQKVPGSIPGTCNKKALGRQVMGKTVDRGDPGELLLI